MFEKRRTPLETLEGGAVEAVMPLMRAAVERGEALLLKMHDHGFGSESTPEMARPSPYMLELGRHLSHCRCNNSQNPCATLNNLYLAASQNYVILTLHKPPKDNTSNAMFLPAFCSDMSL